MILTNEILLGETVDGTPSGNYDGSSLAFSGDPVIAANYYGGLGSTQTAYFRTTGFRGRIVLEGTLNDGTTITGGLAAWFEVGIYDALITPRTDYHPITTVGNFTYMRVRVEDFTAGTINSVTLTY
jgi:hypothetical protein